MSKAVAMSADFQIYLADAPGSLEDWRRALAAPESELAKLSREKAGLVKKFGSSEADYARGVLVGKYRKERLWPMAEKLGRTAARVLGEINEKYKLVAVLEKVDPGEEEPVISWLLRIQGPRFVREVEVPPELLDSLAAGNGRAFAGDLKTQLMKSLESKEGNR